LLASGLPLLLVFSDAGCGPCDALLPDVAGWEREYAQQLAVAVIASGDQERNRSKAERHGLVRVLLQSEREASDAYLAHVTPMAVVIDSDGLIASPAVGGVDAIRTLVAQAIASPLAVVQVPSSNGHRDDAPTRASSRVGERAPELVLADLDGHQIALTDLYADRTLAIFWNPGCGFCQSMLDDLKAFERDPPAGAPRLVVISSGDPEQTREHDLRSRVLLDPDGQAMAAFEAHGTPMGVLIEHGRIASPIAAGAVPVLELAAPETAPGNHNGNHR
jgi:thiol-disulfide isomerase/thioredoxin